MVNGEFEALVAILDNVPFMAWYKDSAGRFVSVNRYFAAACGKTKQEIIGKNDFDIWPQDRALAYVKDDAEVMRTQVKKAIEEQVEEVSGKRWVETFKAPVFDAQGKVIGTIGMTKDISRRMQFQKVLEDQKIFIKSMIDAVPDLVFYKDRDSVYLGCNRAFAQDFIGLKEEEIIGKTDLDFVKDPHLANFFRLKDMEVLARGGTGINEETVQLHNGEWVALETVKTPFYNKEGQAAGLIGISRDITARKRFEQELQEQRDFSQMLLQTIPSAVYTIDTKRQITSWNAMAERITGYAANEVMGRNIQQLHLYPCQGDCPSASDSTAELQINQTCKIRTKNGEIRYISKNLAVLRDNFGAIIGRIECFDDVTQKVLIEEQLKESEMRLNLATSSTNVGMWDWKIQSGETVFNEQWANICGYTLPELEPVSIDTWRKLTHPEDLGKSIAVLNKYFSGITDYYECELRLRHKQGHWVWVLDRGKVIEWDAAKKPVRMVGTHIDITERKRAEEDLRHKERLLSAVAMSIQELIENRDYLGAVARCFEIIGPAVLADQASFYVNHQDEQGQRYAVRMIKWTSETGEAQLDHAGTRQIPLEHMAGFTDLLRTGEAYYGAVKALKDDRTRTLLEEQNIHAVIMLPIMVRGMFWGFVGFGESKYEKRKIESELSILRAFASSLEKTVERSMIDNELEAAKQSAETANQLKSQFVANISHEIRTPMHAILGYAALLKGSLQHEENISYLKGIQKAGDTLMTLIDDILDLSKIEAGKLELQTGEITIQQLFSDIRDIFSVRMEEKQLDFQMEIDQNIAAKPLSLDEVRVRQILFNLVGNAVKFTEEGWVRVSARMENADVLKGTIDLVFEVIDTGIGIPQDQQKIIFEPFKQTDGQSNKRYGGTGLGLAISLRLIEMMGGEIGVQSEPGKGAVFTAAIPRVVCQKTCADPLTPEMKHADFPLEGGLAAIPAAETEEETPQPVPEKMIKELELLQLGLWEKCIKTNRISDLKKLAKTLYDLAVRYNHAEMLRFAHGLQGAANTFDLKNIKILLRRFPAIIERLKAN